MVAVEYKYNPVEICQKVNEIFAFGIPLTKWEHRFLQSMKTLIFEGRYCSNPQGFALNNIHARLLKEANSRGKEFDANELRLILRRIAITCYEPMDWEKAFLVKMKDKLKAGQSTSKEEGHYLAELLERAKDFDFMSGPPVELSNYVGQGFDAEFPIKNHNGALTEESNG